ncbi:MULTISPECIES: acyl-CoA dehydrogenase family protein [unclassified Rhizobium]|uniref:acyl-CoA dehydrogenase family protein n=1 Tax=unclassified Rhizobium TaxID=2613769 RepID=UPI001786C97F|nr:MULTISPECIES: acyl-CoA dehydrogenase family protein [unclassified Rhizobium]MBD8689202.1 acyl-CoA dehydrogenase family protein [Rhizobium sp. CFBP 13644]MBD8693252.1 acyl-CoA dehydrogenase family protein [Rhizobium sp. CFBP 13717]
MTNMNRTEEQLADLNQPSLWSGINAYRTDPLIVDLTSSLSRPLRDEFDQIGRYVTSSEAQELARMANVSAPKLHTHGPRGERLDQVEFHPAWHALMRRSMSSGLHSSAWENTPETRGNEHKARATKFYLTAQLEAGHLCPLTMTHASVAAMMSSPRVQKEWAPKVLSRKYDSSQKPAMQKTAVTIGMGMTEKQGGTDVRANRTTAERVGEGIYRLSGHKWFLSAPMSDGFVMLAQMGDGMGCFLVPRFLEDGSANGLHFQRLKDKLGNRSNASAEVEFTDAFGYLLGEPGGGISTILDMVTLTRLDCALASSGMMRASLAEAVHYARGRNVFGKALVAQPIMTRVLADMALDVAASTALSFRLAAAFDSARNNPAEAAYARVMTPVVKYWCCKIAPPLIYEAMESLGGNGYIEDRPIARHYREAPVNAIWEGSGNVMALDVLRVLQRGRDLFDLVFEVLERDLGPSGKKTTDVLRAAIALCERDEGAARMLVEQFALAAAAAELCRIGAGRIADAFLETRLAGGFRHTYGMLDSRFDASYIIDLLYPPAN